jgi:hypothetical protein
MNLNTFPAPLWLGWALLWLRRNRHRRVGFLCKLLLIEFLGSRPHGLVFIDQPVGYGIKAVIWVLRPVLQGLQAQARVWRVTRRGIPLLSRVALRLICLRLIGG